MNERKIEVTNKDRIDPTHKNEYDPYEYYKYEVTKRNAGGCEVAIYEIPPKKANYPYHYHMKNEEVFYVISGAGILETPDGDRDISAGDVVVCPPNENGAHRIFNPSETETLTYIDFDTVNSPEVVHYPHSGKVGVISEEFYAFYKKVADVDYYEGE